MKNRAATIFQLIKHIYETAINDFHAIFKSNCRHYLTTLPNSDRSKSLPHMTLYVKEALVNV